MGAVFPAGSPIVQDSETEMGWLVEESGKRWLRRCQGASER